MLDEKRIKKAEKNIRSYLQECLLKKQTNETAKLMYVKNSELSLETADKLLEMEKPGYKPYLWVVVIAYYAMFYIANAVLLNIGYKVGEKISHKITADALIVFIRNRLKKELIEGYEETKADALDLIASRVNDLITSFDLERVKRSKFQYKMDKQLEKAKALTSLRRAKLFVFEMKKLL